MTNLKHKTEELYRLKHRIKRYKRRLIKEGFRKSRERGLDVVLYDFLPHEKINDSTVLVHRDHESNMDINQLIEIAKDSLPSLYRRYHSLMQMYETKCSQLEEEVRKAS